MKQGRSLRAARALLCAAAFSFAGCAHQQKPVVDTATPQPGGPELTDAYLTDNTDNAISKTTFPADTKPIYLEFAAKNSGGMAIKAIWLADAPTGGARAMLGEQMVMLSGIAVNGMVAEQPPLDGWKPGAYHVDVYFGDTIVHSEHFKIVNMPGDLDDNLGSPLPSPSPDPNAMPSPLAPTVTPIPSATPYVAPPTAPEDGLGHVLISVGDRFMLHTSNACHDVTFTINVNGRRQGTYAVPGVTNDISMDFQQGINTLELRWDAPSDARECQLAIALNHNHRLRTLTQVHVFRLSPPHGTESLSLMVR